MATPYLTIGCLLNMIKMRLREQSHFLFLFSPTLGPLGVKGLLAASLTWGSSCRADDPVRPVDDNGHFRCGRQSRRPLHTTHRQYARKGRRPRTTRTANAAVSVQIHAPLTLILIQSAKHLRAVLICPGDLVINCLQILLGSLPIEITFINTLYSAVRHFHVVFPPYKLKMYRQFVAIC